MLTKNVLILVGVLLATVLVCSAQENPVYRSYKKSSHRQEALAKVGIKADLAEWLATIGYSDKTIRDLRSAGIDVMQAWPDYYGRDERLKAVLSDCIVMGTISRVEFDSSLSARFHTIAYIDIEQYLRNDYKIASKQLPIFINSGPLRGGGFEINSGDVEFTPGERVLVFLDAAATLLAAKRNSPEYFQSLIRKETVQFTVAGLRGGKYVIINGEAICLGISKPLKQVIQDVRSTLKVIQRSRDRN